MWSSGERVRKEEKHVEVGKEEEAAGVLTKRVSDIALID